MSERSTSDYRISVRLEPERKAALAAIAKLKGCSMNAVIRMALDEYVRRHKQEG